MNDRRLFSLAFALFLFFLVLAAFLLATAPSFAQSGTRYVAPYGNCGGVSPCYSTIQDAVDAATGGDTVKIAEGVYTGTGFQVVYISKAITVTGGYTTADWVNSYPITQPTVIDAENVARRRGVYIDGNGVPTITLAALMIQRGYAENADGGGVYIMSGTVSLRDSQVIGNKARQVSQGGYGGGVYMEGGFLILIGNSFLNNEGEFGGGLCMRAGTLISNIFENNYAHGTGGGGAFLEGGAIAMSGNIFRSNSAGFHGGGAHSETSVITITDNTFEENSAGNTGGGMSASDGVLVDNTFRANISSKSGGGLWLNPGAVTLVNNTFLSNLAVWDGGGLFVNRTAVTMIGNTILNNTARRDGGAVVILGIVDAQNDIIAGNASPWEAVYVAEPSSGPAGALTARHWTLANNGDYAITTNGGSVVLTNTIVSSHTVGGFAGPGIIAGHTLFFNSGTPCSSGAACSNSIAGDPSFINPAEGNYHLGPWSAAVDQGVNAGVMTDADGDPRPMRSGFDLGADEQSELPMASFLSSTPDWLQQTTVFTDTTYSFGSTTRQWAFGDGEMSSLEDPTHIYASPGVWTVVLTETNAAGHDVFSDSVTVYGPPAADFTTHPTRGVRPLTVTFTNTTTTNPLDDPTLSYLWRLGDGEVSILESPTHVYDQANSFTVTLAVSNAAGSHVITRTNYITAYEAVAAGFTASPTSGVAPLNVAFANESSGDYNTCAWRFGDGYTYDDCQDPGHLYATSGVFTASLTVSGPGGADALTRTSYITAHEAVMAGFAASPTSGVAPLEVTFTNESSGDYSDSLWEFGDGLTSTLNSPAHVYVLRGVFTVSLTVSGPGGQERDSKAAYIIVTEHHRVYLPIILRQAP